MISDTCRECAGLQKERKVLKQENKQYRLERQFLLQQLEAHQHALMTLGLENQALAQKFLNKDTSSKIYKQMYRDVGGGQEGISDVCMDCLLFDNKMAIEKMKKEGDDH